MQLQLPMFISYISCNGCMVTNNNSMKVAKEYCCGVACLTQDANFVKLGEPGRHVVVLVPVVNHDYLLHTRRTEIIGKDVQKRIQKYIYLLPSTFFLKNFKPCVIHLDH